ncbi:MAG: hypothetical protein RR477_06305 [Raoultibacter sp.]
MSFRGNYAAYVSVGEQKAKAARQRAKLRKKNPDLAPVLIEGRTLAKTWWGQAWNRNLESYADFSNRITRGKSYVKNGMVLDLQITQGLVKALVSGSRATPYEVLIGVDILPEKRWKKISHAFSNKIGSVAELAEGKFPEELAQTFLAQKEGLFPSPQEIHLGCSCPDWAEMCKHISAVLYGVGARFDEDPLLFFMLRGIPFEDLLKKSVDEKMASLLQNADAPSARIIEEENIEALFGL